MNRNDDDIPPALREALEREFDDEENASDLEEVWALLGEAAPADAELPEAEDTWEEVRRHVEANAEDDRAEREADREPVRRNSARRSVRRLWRWSGVVAVVLVLVCAAWWWSQPVELTAAPGTTVTRTLPDGSTVELNADTRLTHSRAFSTVSVLEAERRVARLDGEAYFEVESGDRPFIVWTPTARVEVVGTAFSVRSRAEDEHDTHVALAEGRLRVAGTSSADTAGVALRPGQAVTLGAEGPLTTVRDTSIDRVLAWRRGGFALTAQPLPVLVRSLERRFGTSIRLDSSIPESTLRDSLTLYYSERANAETILHDVCMARNLSYRATANGYVLARDDASPSSTSP